MKKLLPLFLLLVSSCEISNGMDKKQHNNSEQVGQFIGECWVNSNFSFKDFKGCFEDEIKSFLEGLEGHILSEVEDFNQKFKVSQIKTERKINDIYYNQKYKISDTSISEFSENLKKTRILEGELDGKIKEMDRRAKKLSSDIIVWKVNNQVDSSVYELIFSDQILTDEEVVKKVILSVKEKDEEYQLLMKKTEKEWLEEKGSFITSDLNGYVYKKVYGDFKHKFVTMSEYRLKKMKEIQNIFSNKTEEQNHNSQNQKYQLEDAYQQNLQKLGSQKDEADIYKIEQIREERGKQINIFLNDLLKEYEDEKGEKIEEKYFSYCIKVIKEEMGL